MSSIQGLLDSWDKVTACMDEHGKTVLGANEEATRYALIDPILVALGWDVSNPKYVRVECCQDSGSKPDYTLKKGESTVAFVEAKKWGAISDGVEQIRNYCNSERVNIGVLSDGGGWYIYDFSRVKSEQTIAFVDADIPGYSDVKKLLTISQEAIG
jgi:predicted type IV restriction endonuclease